MKRIRFSKDELEVMITALSMAGEDFEGHTDLPDKRAYRASNSAIRKLSELVRRQNEA